MSWCWFALRSERPADAVAVAPVWDRAERPAGYLAAWKADAEVAGPATKIDRRAVDPDGGAAWVSLVLAPYDAGLPFDDPAVAQAIRQALAMVPADVRSTLVVGDDRFAGAVTAVHDRHPDRLAYDPFACLFPARLLRVGPGLFGVMPPPVGPGTQRYGGGNPWPWDRFP